MRILVNADDYGWNRTCSRAIFSSFQKGYIDTTTAMPVGIFFDEAVNIIKDTIYENSVGIHFNLTEGIPLTEGIKFDSFFCNKEGCFHGKIRRYKRMTVEQKLHAYQELWTQAVKYANTGLLFHHADSHHHIHTAPYITPIVIAVMKEFNIKGLRQHRDIGDINVIKKGMKKACNFNLRCKNLLYTTHFGNFDDVFNNPNILEKQGLLEIMCHPDLDTEGVLIDRASGCTYESPYGRPMSELTNKLLWKE